MTCSDARQLMGRYVANGLSAADAERLESHLCSCPLCEAEIDLRLGVLPAAALDVAPPMGLREEILAAVIHQPATMPDDCYVLAPELSAFIDGELCADERAAVGRHIASCSACAQQLQSLRGLDAVARSLPAHEPSRRLAARIYGLIPSPARASLRDRLVAALRWRPVQVGLPIAVTGALALMATVPFWRPAEPGGTPTMSSVMANTSRSHAGPSALNGGSGDLAAVLPTGSAGGVTAPVAETSGLSTASAGRMVARSARGMHRAPMGVSPRPDGIRPRSTEGPKTPDPAQPTVAMLIVPTGATGSKVVHLASVSAPERLADEPVRLQVPTATSSIHTVGKTPAREPEDQPGGDVVMKLDVTSEWQPAPSQNLIAPAGVYAYD